MLNPQLQTTILISGDVSLVIHILYFIVFYFAASQISWFITTSWIVRIEFSFSQVTLKHALKFPIIKQKNNVRVGLFTLDTVDSWRNIYWPPTLSRNKSYKDVMPTKTLWCFDWCSKHLFYKCILFWSEKWIPIIMCRYDCTSIPYSNSLKQKPLRPENEIMYRPRWVREGSFVPVRIWGQEIKNLTTKA